MSDMPILIQQAAYEESLMMSYILQSRDGSIIVIDGGGKTNAPRLLEALRQLGGEKPRVSLWLMTHPHNDHIDAFLYLWRKCREQFTVDRIIHAFPHPDFLQQYAPKEALEQQAFEDIRHEFEHLLTEVHRGDRFSYGDFAFEVIYSNEEACTENPCNNASTVFMTEVLGTRILFLGDMGCEAEERLLDRPEKLKADIVQMAHHGQEGVTKEFYAVVDPRLCLWSTAHWLWVNDAGNGPGTGPFLTLGTRRWMEELNITSHLVSKDGDGVVRFLGDGRYTFGKWQ